MDDSHKYKIIADRDARYDGKIYFAVKTTGIVCRPSCPANRPHKKNVTFYATLDEALRNGFRAYKRCKPELLLENNIIESLEISEEGSISETAKSLGITERHLRRVTNRQVGISPNKLIKSKRLLAAKNLLANTKLPIIDVVFSAGFNSLRQFNDNFKTATGITPSKYRASHRAENISYSEAVTVTIKLAYKKPFEWSPLKDALLAHMVPGLEVVDLGTLKLYAG